MHGSKNAKSKNKYISFRRIGQHVHGTNYVQIVRHFLANFHLHAVMDSVQNIIHWQAAVKALNLLKTIKKN